MRREEKEMQPLSGWTCVNHVVSEREGMKVLREEEREGGDAGEGSRMSTVSVQQHLLWAVPPGLGPLGWPPEQDTPKHHKQLSLRSVGYVMRGAQSSTRGPFTSRPIAPAAGTALPQQP